MNVKIQIEIDGKVIELTMDEARILHQEMSAIFVAKQPSYPYTEPIQPYQPTGPIWTGTPYCPGSDQQCSTS